MRSPFHKPGAGRSGIISTCLLLLLAIGLSDCGGSVRNTPPPPPPPSTDTTPPTVSVTAPSSGSTVSGTVTVSASASDNVAVAGVQFQVDGSDTGAEDTTAPYSISWNSTGVANGTHTLTAVARDTSNNSTTSAGVNVTVDNTPSSDTTPPTVSITAPSPGSTVSGTITVSADASDDVAVAGVQFQVDGVDTGTEDTTAPYSISLSTTSLTNANHTLTAVARDTSNNNTTSTGVTITVDNQSGSTFSATITLQPTQTKQTWLAWWGTLSPRTVGNSPVDVIPLAVQGDILDTLATDLGLTGGRIPIAQKWAQNNNGYESTNDDANPNNIVTSVFYPQFRDTYSSSSGRLFDPVELYQNTVLPLRNLVLTNGDTFTTYVTVAGPEASYQPHWLPNPPACDNGNEEEFAELMEAYLQWQQDDFGYRSDFVSVNNEPATAFFDDCNNPKTTQLAEMAKAVGRRLQGRGWNTTLVWEENVSPGSIWKYDSCHNDSECSSYIGLLSYHGYDYNASAMPGSFATRNTRRDRAASLGVGTAMTEICCKGSPVSWKGSYAHGLALARDIYWNMTEADTTVWMQLGSVQVCGSAGCPTGSSDYISVEPSSYDNFYKLPAYFGMRQFSRWIRPGYVRVDTTCSGCTTDPATGLNVKTVTFRRPDGSYVIVAINDQDNSASLTLSGFPGGTYQIEGVEPTVCTDPPGGAGVRDRCTPIVFASQTISGSQNLVLTLPARSIVTFH